MILILYLKKYVGQYRVKADYDLDTNDFPRLESGGIDPSFDDLYIECKNDIKIRHGVGNVLSCHIPSKSRGLNVLRQIYQDKVSSELPKEKDVYFNKLCSELVDNQVLVSAEVLDYEVYFEFKAATIDYIAKLVGAKTYGSNISPFSSKNMPKEPYNIPEKDESLYKEAIKDYPTKIIDMGSDKKTMIDGSLILKANKEFDKVIKKSKPKGFDVDKDRKQKRLKGKKYIHSIGLWEEYCEFLKEFLEKQ